jgi:GTP-binding protein EngB required for normal cell division
MPADTAAGAPGSARPPAPDVMDVLHVAPPGPDALDVLTVQAAEAGIGAVSEAGVAGAAPGAEVAGAAPGAEVAGATPGAEVAGAAGRADRPAGEPLALPVEQVAAEPSPAPAPALTRRARRAATRPDPIPDVTALMDVLMRAVEVGGERLEPAATANARAAVERAGQRMRLGADLTVVALVGATGSGKSSLFNALAGMEIAEVGARRPTTSEPTSCVWGSVDADPLLDWLAVPERHRSHRESVLDADSQAGLQGLVLLDLPDHDSAFVDHRLEVDRLVNLVDLLVWVVDPQKYADEALHSGYLRPFSSRRDVMLVVLNQIDRLGPEEAQTCEHDLRRLLDADGLRSVRLLTTSAARGDGVPDLHEVLEGVVRQRESALGRTVTDLVAAAAELSNCVGAAEPDLAALGTADRLVAALSDAAGVPVVLDAVDADHRRRARAGLGWPYPRWWRSLRPDPLRQTGLGRTGAQLRDLIGAALPHSTPSQQAQVDRAARTVADEVSGSLPPRWADAVRAATGWHRGGCGLAAALDDAVRGVDLAPARSAWWLVGRVVQALLAVASIAGFVWLAVIGILDWIRADSSAVPFLGPLPLPTAMLLGGLLLGGIIDLVARLLVESGIGQRREELVGQFGQAVRGIAQRWVLDDVADVLADHRDVRECLSQLR